MIFAPRDGDDKDGVPNEHRLYQHIARTILDHFGKVGYELGDRLPAERDLAQRYNTSRATVREALIALEVQGFVDVRIGSGAYVRRIPNLHQVPTSSSTPMDLVQARMVLGGEAAAMAAPKMTSDDRRLLTALGRSASQMGRRSKVALAAGRDFHLKIASMSGNVFIERAVLDIWQTNSILSFADYVDSDTDVNKPNVMQAEYDAIIAALQMRDSFAARDAVHRHFLRVIDNLMLRHYSQFKSTLRF